MSETEQNKSEEATPYKIRRARQRGMVARGADLGFFSAVAGFCAFALLAGERAARHLSDTMARILAETANADSSGQVLALIARAVEQPIAIALTAGLTIAIVVLLIEIVQVRGIVVSGHPLKPDFNRLNPGKNLKRLFSSKMLIETLKNCGKLAVYGVVIYLVVDAVALPLAQAPRAGVELIGVWREALFRLLAGFALGALLFAALDQLLSRRHFQKEMRMSRSELNREFKEREGEPRQKQKRKRMHAEFAKQARALAGLNDADLLIVNPEHFAVALKYDATAMGAPQIAARGRNRVAQLLKNRAFVWSILTISDPPLARALYRAGDVGQEIPSAHYHAVAQIYLRLRDAKASPYGEINAGGHA